MLRLAVVMLALIPALACSADEPAGSPAEAFLHEGNLAAGETALMLKLDADASDDESRFGLGVIQFCRAIENLGRALYEYGAVSENARQPILRLPVPLNPDPLPISYPSLGRVLDGFAMDLRRAEATLSGIQDDDVKLRIRLAKIKMDFTGTGEQSTNLLELLNHVNRGRFEFEKVNPEFRVHFDRGDVAWLRAYCHLLSAMVEGYRALDLEAEFGRRVKDVFPVVKGDEVEDGPRPWEALYLADASRLRRMRMHLVAVCELNRETWHHIRNETDDDFEWLPHPKQTDQLGLPLTTERIDAWLAMMAQWEGLFKGELLLPSYMLNFVRSSQETGKGLNVKTLLDDPPQDFLNVDRIREQGIDDKYLEDEEGRQVFQFQALFFAFQAFNGPFGFASAVRMN